MGKGLGIAGLIILLISFPIPVLGTFITFLALLIVAIGALFGDKVFAIATTIIAAVKIFMLSPGWMLVMYGSPDEATKQTYLILTFAFLALPILAIIMRAVMGGKDKDAES